MKRKLIEALQVLILALCALLLSAITYVVVGIAWDSSAANEAAKIEHHKIGLKYGN